MFYAAFNSISVISRRQLTLFMSFLGFTSTNALSKSDEPTIWEGCQGPKLFAIFKFQRTILQRDLAFNAIFRIFNSTGRRPASLCHGPLSVVRPSVRALTFSLNIFSEATYRILMKLPRNVPAIVLFRICWKNLIPSKTVVVMATKLKKKWKLWKSSCQKL